MKRYIRNTILTSFLIVFAACSLKEEPTSFVNKYNFYENKDQCYAALNAVNSFITIHDSLVALLPDCRSKLRL